MNTRSNNLERSTDGKPGSKPDDSKAEVLKFKKRMLQWPNPVEFVNNMYGSHPGDDDGDDIEYFKKVFSK